MSALRTIKSFVLRTGRITEGQKKAYEELYKKYGIPGSIIIFKYNLIFEMKYIRINLFL